MLVDFDNSQKSLGPRSKRSINAETPRSNSSVKSFGRRANASVKSLDGISERSANGSRRSMSSSRRKPKRQVISDEHGFWKHHCPALHQQDKNCFT